MILLLLILGFSLRLGLGILLLDFSLIYKNDSRRNSLKMTQFAPEQERGLNEAQRWMGEVWFRRTFHTKKLGFYFKFNPKHGAAAFYRSLLKPLMLELPVIYT